MKLTELSNFYLSYMVQEYSKTHNRFFSDWNKLVSMQSDQGIEFICDAFIKLEKDGLIKCLWLDNVPSNIQLEIEAIIEAEENTKLRKIYSFLKELNDWL